jgi:hypothetical protein
VSRALGYRPDEPDERDHLLAVPDAVAPPVEADCCRLIVDTLDQGQLGACVLHSVSQNIRAAHVRAGITSPALLSRLLAYYLARAATGDTAEDTGTEVRTALKQLRTCGFAPESAWPYDIAKFAQRPPDEAWRLAFDQSVAAAGIKVHFARIASTGSALVLAMRHAIASGLPISFGADVSEAFCEGQIGEVVMPPRAGQIAGGHSQLVIAYKTAPDGSIWFGVLNSWGDDFGVEINGVKGCSWWHESYMTWNGSRASGPPAQPTSDFWTVDEAPYFSEVA